MPNWCLNRVTVTGESGQLDKFQRLVDGKDNHGNDSEFSFHRIIPMPDLLINTRSPIKVVDTVAEAIECNQEMNKTFMGIESDGRVGAMTKNASDELIEKYGHNNWYDWAFDNWGTKWQPSDINVDKEVDYLEYSFDTAWGPPEGIFQELSIRFPNLHIAWFYDEPGMEISGYLEFEGNDKQWTIPKR